ncbi:MAG: transporter substrate-binding domain-containing protein [Prevotella sp.]|nr:transporter substrate-binding domain-containing protein [Prevotella sp.]MBR2882375.1 transporter substrate-binding domain-containing protein [Prevotella sp.]
MSNRYTIIYSRLMAILLLLCSWHICPEMSAKNVLGQYTEEHPLTIIADWDFPPYDYRNNNGNPSGYHVELISTMLDELNIPYTYVMREWSQSLELFSQGKADITITPLLPQEQRKVYSSHASLGTYRVAVAYKKGTAPIKTIDDIKSADSIMFKKDDYGARKIIEMGYAIKDSQYIQMRKGLEQVANGKIKYYVLGEYPIKWVIKQMHLSEVETSLLDIPSARIKFISHDKELINAIDDRFYRLDQAGKINKLHNKWLHPEKAVNDASYTALYITIAVIILIIIFLVSNRIMAVRLRRKNEQYSEKNKIMQSALLRSKNSVVKYDLSTKRLTNIYGDFLPDRGLSYEEYLNSIHPDDQQKVLDFIDKIIESHNTNLEITYRWNIGTIDQPIWRILCDQSIVELDRKNRPINIISTFIDVTEEREKEQESNELLEKYSQLLDMTLVGFALYDRNGQLLETNKRMQEIFKFKHPKDEYYYNTSLFDLPIIDHKEAFKHDEHMHFCTMRSLILKRNVSNKLEIRIRPIKDDNGKTVYLLITAQDLLMEYDLHKKQKKNDLEIRSINQKMLEYQNELRYLLEKSNMRVWRSSADSKEIKFYKDLDSIERTVSFDEFIDNTQDLGYKETAVKLIGLQNDAEGKHKVILPVKNLAVQDDIIHWYSMNSITDYDNDGNAIGRFGLIRDVSELIHSQEKLKEETIRANNSKHQKSVFLANMTHEIRTPLNAIVGFCDLLQTVDSPDDRKEFIRIIRNNCNMLLHLINDILDISTIDESGLSIMPMEIDFAESFNDICATLSQQILNPQIEFIKENPYDSLIVVTDKNRIEQIITNFTTNAIKHTQKGHIRVGYRVENNGIYIYCEDTGRGIPKEKCAAVFERFVKLDDFVQGTGLGLSICKAITDACQGKIGVESDTGQGATFWFWFPCEIKQP